MILGPCIASPNAGASAYLIRCHLRGTSCVFGWRRLEVGGWKGTDQMIFPKNQLGPSEKERVHSVFSQVSKTTSFEMH